jgi:hypothetical protein
MLFFSRIKTWVRNLTTLYGILNNLDFSLEKNDEKLNVSNTSLNLVHQPKNVTGISLTCNIICEFKGYEHIQLSFVIFVYEQTLEHQGKTVFFKLDKFKISERDM